MDRHLLVHLPVILAVARRASFAAAAAELGIGTAAASHAVKLVEDRLGLPLFARTTRSVALTEAGADFVRSIAPAFAEVGETMDRLRAAGGRISGTLRLNVSRVAASMVLTPILAELARRHPELVVEVASDEALVDIVAAGFDAGVRLGEMIAEDMVAVRLGAPCKAVLVAAPAYLRKHGAPRSISDLAAHNCINYRLLSSGGMYAWELLDRGREVAVRVKGSVIVNDACYAAELALAGVGIAYLFEPLVRAHLRQRKLTRLLPSTAIEEPGLFLYYPRRASMTPKLRAFVDVARELARRPA